MASTSKQPSSEKIYAIECKNYKWYIGRTFKPLETRFAEHLEGKDKSAWWLKTHQPLKILFVKESLNKYDEDAVVFEYIEKYGIDNVRGGTYSQVDLTASQIKEIKTKIQSANNKCFKCGNSGHFANKCLSHAAVVNNPKTKAKTPKTTHCYRCGRASHLSPDCFANVDINGKPL